MERGRVAGDKGEEVALRRILWVVMRETSTGSGMEKYPWIDEQVRYD